MTDTERTIIPVPVDQARQYIDAIEGLVFDPQPYRPSVLPDVTVRPTGMIASFLEVLNRKPKTEKTQRDPVEDNLNGRYSRLIANRYYQLTDEPGFKDVAEEERINVDGTRFYIETERPSLLVEMGKKRTFQVDLQLVRDARWAIIYSHLRLKQQDVPHVEANLFMSSQGMYRQGQDTEKDLEWYTPAFAEQQRLLAVNNLLRNHIKPTRSW